MENQNRENCEHIKTADAKSGIYKCGKCGILMEGEEFDSYKTTKIIKPQMNKPNFTIFDNEEGKYTIVYDVNGEHETIVGVVGKKRTADESCRQLNNVLFLEREPKWIDVKKRTPPPSELVIYYAPSVARVGYLLNGIWYKFQNAGEQDSIVFSDVTHWQPLPDAPTL